MPLAKTIDGYNADLSTQIQAIQQIVLANSILAEILGRAPQLKLERYYVGAGCIAQSVWNHWSGFEPDTGIDDFDLVYFDPDLSYDKECEVIAAGNRLFGDLDLPARVDIKNQARVHLWYEQHFGYPIPPYVSLEAAINSWPTTATAIGIRKDGDEAWRIYAPFGLNDLFGLVVRANKLQITEEIYMKKVRRWTSVWPSLHIVPWE